jgi:hypothetical protein
MTTNDFADKLIEKYGPLMTIIHLSELLDRSVNGLRFSFCRSKHKKYKELKKCARKVGRRLYYPSDAVAEIICSE